MRGELRVVPHDLADPFPPTAQQVLLRKGDSELLFDVERARAADRALLVSLRGLDDRDAARALAGYELHVSVASLPPPGPDELYVYELEGARVVDESGRDIGVVVCLLAGAAHDLLQINFHGEERLLPYVSEMLCGFDRERRVLTVRPIPGLWDES